MHKTYYNFGKKNSKISKLINSNKNSLYTGLLIWIKYIDLYGHYCMI